MFIPDFVPFSVKVNPCSWIKQDAVDRNSAGFPCKKKQEDRIDLQNEKLANKYGVKDFQAVYLVEGEGGLIQPVPFTAETKREAFKKSLRIEPGKQSTAD